MSKAKVFVTRPDFPENGIRLLQEKYDVEMYPYSKAVERDYLLEHVKGASALFCITSEQIDKAVLDAAGPELKIISSMSLGFEHIDIEECKKRNIIVCNSPNPMMVASVAEFTIGLLLAVARKIVEASGAIQRGEWIEGWNPNWYVGRGLTGAVVGIVGMGRVGKAVFSRLQPFGVMQVLYFDIFHPIVEVESMGARYAPFEELLKESDYVISTCNLTEKSRGIFDRKAFSLMKSSAAFINTSRGGVVDQEALVEALREKRIKAAAIDVMHPEPLPRDHELLSLPNIIVTPHIAALEESAMWAQSSLTAENIIEVLEGRDPLTLVY
ncbi:glyoxylate reductase/hydroxypyruvate reductase-like [Uloborus diversus]|uniref:glyoxylate reductase/hydroxypyruvate reductase-like n=1 Tax=Uloborus diversus TaxID=327109 RepID=UPI00240A887D|nr:glyoxylate reductase/hydroxypyruvate reductase-like [Uloborus diversus]